MHPLIPTLLLAAFCPAAALAQTSPMHFVRGDRIMVLQSGTVSNNVAANTPVEGGPAVWGDVRTFANFASGVTVSGSLYDLAHAYQGVQYANSPLRLLADGTTDGQYNYGIVNITGGNAVYRFDRDWQSPALLFSGVPGGGFLGGITYDPVLQSLWLHRSGGAPGGTFERYTTGGAHLGGFVPAIQPSSSLALAFDPADRTLWAVQQNTRCHQYTLGGVLLQQFNTSDFFSTNGIGAEFNLIPTPGSLVVIAGAAAAFFRRRRAAA